MFGWSHVVPANASAGVTEILDLPPRQAENRLLTAKRSSLGDVLQALPADVVPALEQLRVPSYVIDEERRIRWLNGAALELVGDVRGRLFTSVVQPWDVERAKTQFTRQLLGLADADIEMDVVDRNGSPVGIQLSAVRLTDGERAVGVFGFGRTLEQPRAPVTARRSQLTPRQHEVLLLLADGLGTSQIAAALQLSEATVRNHVRDLMRRLDVHSRLAAVASARQNHFI